MKLNTLSPTSRRLRTTGRLATAAALAAGVVTVSGVPTAVGQTPDPTQCAPGDTFLFDWESVDWDPTPTFPYTETVTDVAGSGVDATITIVNRGSSDSFVPTLAFPDLVPYFGDDDALRYWQNRNALINPVVVSFSEPVLLDEIANGGSRFLGGTHGGATFRAYSGPNGTGSVVLPDPAIYPDPSVTAVVQPGDPLPGTAPINRIAPTTNMNAAFDPSDQSFVNVGLTTSIAFTVYDYEGVQIQSFVWELFGSTVGNPLTARQNLTTPQFNSAYISGFEFTTCAPPPPSVSLGSFVWVDDNADGLQTAGEPGLAAATVELLVDDGTGTFVAATDLAGDPVPAQVTGADGTYLFDGLPEGSYRVVVTPPDGYVPTSAQVAADNGGENDSNIAGTGAVTGTYVSPTIVLAAGSEPSESGAATGDDQDDAADRDGDMTVDFGFVDDEFPPIGLYEIGNRVWQDRNNSGAIDPGEPTFGAGVVVVLLDDEGDVVAQTETDAQGRYHFGSLLPGDYSVCLPAANFEIGGELAGWHVSTGAASSTTPGDDVDGNNDGVEQPDGSVCSGTVVLDGDQPTDETDESPTGTADDLSNLTVDFGLYQLSLGDLVWYDLDNDGRKDASESPAPGIAMELRDASGAVIATTVTDGSGLYRFSGLPEGTYVVAVSASNFAASEVLDGFVSSTGNNTPAGVAPDPDDDVDNDDNGNPGAGGAIVSAPITLVAGDEPAEQGTGNPTIDFGLIVEEPTDTVPPTTTTIPPDVTLPITGSGGVATTSWIALALVLAGGALMVLVARRPRRS